MSRKLVGRRRRQAGLLRGRVVWSGFAKHRKTVAVRLAGDDILKTAPAGKPCCYGSVVTAKGVAHCIT